MTTVQRQAIALAIKPLVAHIKACMRMEQFYERNAAALAKDRAEVLTSVNETEAASESEPACDLLGWQQLLDDVASQMTEFGLGTQATVLRNTGPCPSEFADDGDPDWSPEESGLITLVNSWMAESETTGSQTAEIVRPIESELHSKKNAKRNEPSTRFWDQARPKSKDILKFMVESGFRAKRDEYIRKCWSEPRTADTYRKGLTYLAIDLLKFAREAAWIVRWHKSGKPEEKEVWIEIPERKRNVDGTK